MPKVTPDSKVTELPSIGPAFAQKLERLGIVTVRELLYHFPARHEDVSQLKSISDLITGETATIQVQIDSIKNVRTRYGKFLTQAVVSDESGSLKVIWFNQPFLTKTLKSGSEVLLSGKLGSRRDPNTLQSPHYELVKDDESEATHLGRIMPVYPETEGVSSKWLRARLKPVVDRIEDFDLEWLPEKLRNEYRLVQLEPALQGIHFPDSQEELTAARKRLGFDELLLIQLLMTERYLKRQGTEAVKLELKKTALEEFTESLDFKLTKAQERSIAEILADISKPIPMDRLLGGDVGSGKTVVAAAAILATTQSKHQAALMAPTSILAEQHYRTLIELFTNYDLKIELATAATRTTTLKEHLQEADLIIGTQALLYKNQDSFRDLALIIVDEQHRFGVHQREHLLKQQKSKTQPHLLTMTATPIPRTMALTLFGDMDISIIDEMPPGRKPVKTFVVPPEKRQDSYDWIREQITDPETNSQAFVICPLVEESDKLEAKSAEAEFKRLSTEVFPDLKLRLLHGRVKSSEKDKTLQEFKDHEFNILVSTSVVEVGIDVANANLMIIEGTERFGLAQLHQLRGRVGRRDKQAYCLLFVDPNYPEALERTKYFAKHNDGLKLAEYDLKSRGPGEVYGVKQAGIPNLKIASFSDLPLIKTTRKAARDLLESDLKLARPENNGILTRFSKFKAQIKEE